MKRNTPADGVGAGKIVFPRILIIVSVILPALAGSILLAMSVWPTSEEVLEILRVGVLPDESAEALTERFGPLLVHLTSTTGIASELVIPHSYAQLEDMLHEKKIDLAYFGGLTFLRTHRRDGVVPVVMRDVDTQFRSYFLVSADSSARSFGDLRGARLAFGSRLSTSGHLMPRRFLIDQAIEPEAWFSEIVYSGAHDKTAELVRDGLVEVGVANAEVVERMFRDGRLQREDLRILWRTPPYPDYVWAVRQELDIELRGRVLDAFVDLNPENAAHADILDRVGATVFLPANSTDFLVLEGVAESLGLLESE